MSDRKEAHLRRWKGHTLQQILLKCGQLPNLKLVLDAGDAASAPAAATKWLDTSGNGYDFFRGTTAGAQATDPTFNGTAGNLSDSEYWSFDGGDFFQYDLANETWMSNLHKNNALFTVAGLIYVASFGGNQPNFATGGVANTNIGISWYTGGSGNLNCRVGNGSGSTFARDVNSTLAVPATTWVFAGLSLDEAGDSATHFLNGSSQSFAASYTTPSAAAASQTLQIGRNVGGNTLPSGSRVGTIMAWEGRALSADELHAIYQAVRGRYNI